MTGRTPLPLHRGAAEFPDHPAIIAASITLNYAECARIADAFAAHLEQCGVGRGDAVMLLLPPSPEYILLIWALFRLGAVACPVNPAFPDAYLAELAEEIAPAFIITDRALEFGRTLRPPALDAAANIAPRDAGDGCDPARPATIVLSSGSSGPPKAIAHSLGNHLAAAARSNRNIPLGPGDCWLLSLPLYHISGLATVIRCALAGAALGIPAHRGALAQALSELPVTHVSLVPAQLRDLLGDAPGRARLQCCKAVLLGGSAAPEALIRDAAAAHLPLHTTYGLTEMASQVCTTPQRADLETLLSAGLPLAPDTIRINARGGICVKGETLFSGYWRKGGVEPPPLHGGYFETGDLGRFDASGRLHVLGRRDNMFICGGENIQPEEVERIVKLYPGVRDAVCVPVEEDRLGRVPAAFVDALPPPDPDALLDFLKTRLPRHALPRYIFSWPENESGGIKPSRKQLAARAAELIRRDQKSER